MPCTIDNRRQTRIETLAFQYGSQFEGSRYGPGGESRLMQAFGEQGSFRYNAARTYSTHVRQILYKNHWAADTLTLDT